MSVALSDGEFSVGPTILERESVEGLSACSFGHVHRLSVTANDIEEDSYSDPFATPPPSLPQRSQDIVHHYVKSSLLGKSQDRWAAAVGNSRTSLVCDKPDKATPFGAGL
jgi:hypothetical protein